MVCCIRYQAALRAAGTGRFAEGEMTVPGAVGDAKGQRAILYLIRDVSMPILAALRLGLASFYSGALYGSSALPPKNSPSGRNFKEERRMKRTQHTSVPASGTGPRQLHRGEVTAQ